MTVALAPPPPTLRPSSQLRLRTLLTLAKPEAGAAAVVMEASQRFSSVSFVILFASSFLQLPAAIPYAMLPLSVGPQSSAPLRLPVGCFGYPVARQKMTKSLYGSKAIRDKNRSLGNVFPAEIDDETQSFRTRTFLIHFVNEEVKKINKRITISIYTHIYILHILYVHLLIYIHICIYIVLYSFMNMCITYLYI